MKKSTILSYCVPNMCTNSQLDFDKWGTYDTDKLLNAKSEAKSAFIQ